jgi:hypothetical protein
MIQLNINHFFLVFEGYEEYDDTVFEAALIAEFQETIREAVSFWETEAGKYLNTTRDRYVKAISYEFSGPLSANLILTDDFASMVEEGSEPYSLRPGLMASGKLRDGRWMPIPMENGQFRTFSVTQPDTMWQHPGFQGYNILDSVLGELEEVLIPEAMDRALERIMK